MTKSIFLKRLSATIQFILGFALGISLIAGISGAFVYAYYKKMSVLPQKPEFSEAEVAPEAANTGETDALVESTTVSQPTEEVIPVVEEAPLEIELPPNAYRATVTWPEGLSLRAEPDIDAERIGGIGTKATIFILENSTDGNWQRVQLPWNGQEGWVKAGNTRKL